MLYCKIMSDQPNSPIHVVINSGHLSKRNLIIGISGGLVLLIIAATLITRFSPKKPLQVKPAAPTPRASVKPTTRTLSLRCPVTNDLCQSGKSVEYNGNPALIFNLPKNTKVTTMEEATDARQFASPPYRKDSPRGFLSTILADNSCYTLTYTFPADVNIAKFDLLPIAPGTRIASSSANLIKINDDNASLIVQLQKRSLDPATKDQPDYIRCTVTNLQSKDVGEYQKLDTKTFSN